MHTRHCLKLAARMHALLEHELGQGIDRQRLLAEPVYARDVLLVCEAMVATDGPLLARAFRRAAAAPDEHATPQASRSSRWAAWLGLDSGFAHTFSSRSSSAPSAT
jgi:hypothetical protein